MAAEVLPNDRSRREPGTRERRSTPARMPASPALKRRPAKAVVGNPVVGSPVLGPAILEHAARVIRVLGHPLRLRLLETLEEGERNVTDLVLASGATQARVSQHLAILRAEGVVGFRRDGGRIYYRITEPKVHRILDCIRECDLPEMSREAVKGLFDLTGDR